MFKKIIECVIIRLSFHYLHNRKTTWFKKSATIHLLAMARDPSMGIKLSELAKQFNTSVSTICVSQKHITKMKRERQRQVMLLTRSCKSRGEFEKNNNIFLWGFDLQVSSDTVMHRLRAAGLLGHRPVKKLSITGKIRKARIE